MRSASSNNPAPNIRPVRAVRFGGLGGVPEGDQQGAPFHHVEIDVDADGAQVNLFSHISATEGQLLLESASLRAADKAKQEAERAKSKM